MTNPNLPESAHLDPGDQALDRSELIREFAGRILAIQEQPIEQSFPGYRADEGGYYNIVNVASAGGKPYAVRVNDYGDFDAGLAPKTRLEVRIPDRTVRSGAPSALSATERAIEEGTGNEVAAMVTWYVPKETEDSSGNGIVSVLTRDNLTGEYDMLYPTGREWARIRHAARQHEASNVDPRRAKTEVVAFTMQKYGEAVGAIPENYVVRDERRQANLDRQRTVRSKVGKLLTRATRIFTVTD